MNRTHDYIFKIVLLGTSAVGKSSLLRRFADDEFSTQFLSTIGVDFRFKSMTIDGTFIKLQIWDTAGQQRFRSISRSYYKDANAVILVYDVSNPSSFQDIGKYWLEEVKKYVSAGVRIYVFANKCDKGEKIEASQRAFFMENEVTWFEMSAKTGKGVNQSIVSVAKQLIRTGTRVEQKKVVMGLQQRNPQKSDKGCC